MEKVYTVKEVREQVKAWRREGLTVGLVPTMGYLHEGHASLIKKAVEQNDKVVVSVFLNPTQFGPTEDLEAYPRDFEADCKLCESLEFPPSRISPSMFKSIFSGKHTIFRAVFTVPPIA